MTSADLPITAQDVREALEHLYANVKLANTTLAQSGRFADPAEGIVPCAQVLRNVLLDAVESLRPLRLQAQHQQATARSYDVLSLRYVACLSVDEIADRLAVGTRQVYRDLRRAEEELAALLQARQPAPRVAPEQVFQAELEALARRLDVVDLGELLQSTVSTVQSLADQKQVALHLLPPEQPLAVTITPGIVKEMLIQMLSALIQQAASEQTLVVRTLGLNDVVQVSITVPSADYTAENSLLQDALLMAQLLGLTATLDVRTHRRDLVLHLPVAPKHTVLVVEDNPGVIELYRRYLHDSPWRAIVVTDPAETCAQALELQPAAIILDVLMPEVDGWTVLQSLRATPQLANIPVIISSVINDPELAQALGAVASLRKPLSRLELMDALHRATRYSGGESAVKPA